MCGRFSITVSRSEYEAYCREMISSDVIFDIPKNILFPRYNISPASHVLAIISENGSLSLRQCFWWLLPGFATDCVEFTMGKNGQRGFKWLKGMRKSHFNSRYDTISNPANRYWHNLLQTKRCILLADGFYEWPAEELLKQKEEKYPSYFTFKDKRVFCFAGLWEKVQDNEGKDFWTVNIITTEPNELLQQLPHHRMPAMLTKDNVPVWLDRKSTLEQVLGCLHPTPAALMHGYRVGKQANYSGRESADCIIPLTS